MKIVSITFKAFRKIIEILKSPIYTPIAYLQFYLNEVKLGKGLKVKGFLKVHITRRGKVNIGSSLELNSGANHNIIGRQQKCIFWVEGVLTIGNNVGMSATAIICNNHISIGDNVKIGGGVVIYDTDFHSLDYRKRLKRSLDLKHQITKPVIIKNHVFIGAHSTILKGVTIGERSIVGACSVVTKNIPSDEIWAGNPARFIRKISTQT